MTERHVPKPDKKRSEVRPLPTPIPNEQVQPEQAGEEDRENRNQRSREDLVVGSVETEEAGGGGEDKVEEEEGENLTEEEELSRMVKNMLASGFTAESIKKKIAPKNKKEKDLLRTMSLGEGRGRGNGRGKPK